MTYLELRTFLDRWIRNSAISAFSQMRLNTVLNEVIDKVEEGGGSGGSSDASDLTSGILDNARLDAVPQSKIVGLVSALADKATQADITTAINSVIDASPGALNTLNELAAALGDDPNFATTITNLIAAKANTADLATVATSGSYNDLSAKPTIPTQITDAAGITTGTFDVARIPDLAQSKITGLSTSLSGKVNTDGSKVLSDVNFSTAKDTKLSEIATSATANITDSASAAIMDNKDAAAIVAERSAAVTLTNKTLTNPSGITPADIGLVAATAAEISASTQINFIGDSFIDLSSGWTSLVLQFEKLTGLKSLNLGVTGQTTTQIKARFDAVSSALYSQSWVFEGGRNDIDINGAISGTATTIKANIAAMVATLAAVGNTRYLIMGVIPKNAETSLTTGGIFVAQLNTDLAALYPGHFVPMAAAIQAGSDGGANDIADVAAGIMPRSKMFDTIHPNTAGFAIEAQQLANNISVLVPNQSKYLTIAAVGGIMQQGQQSYNLGTGGSYMIGDYQAIKIPDQNTAQFLSTLIVGTGGKNLSHTTGSEGQGNTFVGMGAGFSMTTGYNNTAIGPYALYNQTTAREATAIGESAGLNNLANANVFLGKDAGRNNTSGLTNAFLTAGSGLGTSTANGSIYAGFNSGFASNGGANVAIGVSALQNNTGASANNVALGSEALKGASGVASQNIGIGRQTGLINTGSNNIFIGDLAGDNNSSGAKNLVIGHQGDVQSATASNQVNIANVIWGQGASGTGTTKAGTIGIAVTPLTTATLALPASSTTIAPLNVPAGTAPTAPVNGDIWTETSELKIRLNGTTYTITKS